MKNPDRKIEKVEIYCIHIYSILHKFELEDLRLKKFFLPKFIPAVFCIHGA